MVWPLQLELINWLGGIVAIGGGFAVDGLGQEVSGAVVAVPLPVFVAVVARCQELPSDIIDIVLQLAVDDPGRNRAVAVKTYSGTGTGTGPRPRGFLASRPNLSYSNRIG